MAADARARQACINCKTRKKKCNRVLPSCSYCMLKGLSCRYAPAPQSIIDPSLIQRETLTAQINDGLTAILTGPATKKATLYRPVFESLDGIHLEVQRIIRSTGEFVDDLTALYFRHFHNHLPFISRTRFQNSMITTGEPPGADVSILLLSICLTAYGGASSGDRVPVAGTGRQSLYLATKALLAQVQGSMQPSISLVQASLLLAIYEYANGRPEAALVTIAGCARMAYAARIHVRRHDGNQLDIEEAGNTWWGIVVYERAFACEIDTFEQPMATAIPSGNTRLPVERDILDRIDVLEPEAIPNIALTYLTSTKVGGFGRAAQASCIMDQVIRGLTVPDVNSRLILLDSLDASIQSFLAFFLSHNETVAVYCTAVAMTVRALFMMHSHILNIPQQEICANFKSLEEWQKGSLAALDTATRMIIDVADCHYSSMVPYWAIESSPNHIYVVCAALEHMRTRRCMGVFPWAENVKDQLQLYLDKIRHQWIVHS